MRNALFMLSLASSVLAACSSSSSSGSSSLGCGSASVSGTGSLAGFMAFTAIATNNGTGVVTLCASGGMNKGTICGGPGNDVAAGTRSICFFIENATMPSLDPGTYTISTDPSAAVRVGASITECLPPPAGPTWGTDPANMGPSTGSVTLTKVTPSEVAGSATVTFSSGDTADITFDGIVTPDEKCDGK